MAHVVLDDDSVAISIIVFGGRRCGDDDGGGGNGPEEVSQVYSDEDGDHERRRIHLLGRSHYDSQSLRRIFFLRKLRVVSASSPAY